MADRLLRSGEVCERVGIGRTTLWRMERTGAFPARRQIGPNRVGWLESEIEEWMRTRPKADGREG